MALYSSRKWRRYIFYQQKTITINTYYMTKAKKIIRNLGLPGAKTGNVMASARAADKQFIKEKPGKVNEKVSLAKNANEI